MKITEWFARAVAAGLMPEWENISARWYSFVQQYAIQNDDDLTQYITLPNNIQQNLFTFKPIQLRSEGKDLYSLEWRKPTDQDIGKMCWSWNRDAISLAIFDKIRLNLIGEDVGFYVLLANHGQICPTIEDFEKVYGETI